MENRVREYQAQNAIIIAENQSKKEEESSLEEKEIRLLEEQRRERIFYMQVYELFIVTAVSNIMAASLPISLSSHEIFSGSNLYFKIKDFEWSRISREWRCCLG